MNRLKSTLDEVKEADLLLHVVDISHPNFEDHIRVVNDTLKDLEALDKHTILIFNKIDAYTYEPHDEDDLIHEKTSANYTLAEMMNSWMAKENAPCIFISATKKQNIEELREMFVQPH